MVRLCFVFLALGMAGAATVGRWLEKTTEFQLDNGLRVVVLERASSSSVSLALLAKAGWADDPPGRRGLSRVLESMVEEGGFAFGSKNAAEERKALANSEALADKWEAEANKPQPDELLAARLRVDAEQASARLTMMADKATFRHQIENVGGTLTSSKADATTTVIRAEMPAAHAEVFFAGMGAWLQDPSWRNYYRHRQEAANEAGPVDEQTRFLNALAAKGFAKHAWGMPDLDTAELQKLRIREVAAFHRAAFAPGNLVLAVVGSLPASAVRAMVEKHFGSLAAQPAMMHVWTGRDEKPFTLPAARPGLRVLAMGYPRSPLDSPDDAVLDVIAHVLTEGDDSYLQTKLVQTRRVGSVGGAISYPSPAGGGLLAILAFPVPGGSLEDLQKLIQGAINELAEKPLPESAILPAKRRFIASEVRLLEDDGSAADLLARTVASLGSAKSVATGIQQLEAITPADVQRVARQYLKPDSAVSVTWVGERR